jgi:hypothetical protein
MDHHYLRRRCTESGVFDAAFCSLSHPALNRGLIPNPCQLYLPSYKRLKGGGVDLLSSFQSLALSHRPLNILSATQDSPLPVLRLAVDRIGRSPTGSCLTFACHGKIDEKKGEISFDNSLFDEE